MLNDPIADMLTRIRNSNRIHRKHVSMPASRMKVGIAEVLRQEGFIESYKVLEGQPSSTLEIELKFGPDGEHVMRHIDRVSKPGCRRYLGAKEIRPVLNGLGIFVVSTPEGVISDRVAREQNVGGEILCKVS